MTSFSYFLILDEIVIIFPVFTKKIFNEVPTS